MEGKTGGELGLPPSLAALFPDRLQESALGPVPLGWGVRTCASEFGVTMGQSPPGDTYNEVGEGLPFFQGRRDFGSRYPTRRVFCTSPKRFASPGDALVSVRAPVGDVNMATERCCIGRGVAAVRHRSGAVTYTYEMMRSLRDDFADFEAGGTVFGSISSKDFANLLVIAPPVDLVSSYEHMLEPVERAIRNLHESAKVMTALRDALLPRLLQHGGLKMAAAHGGLTAFVNPSEARA
jgi:type I restriction enzyme S subunit